MLESYDEYATLRHTPTYGAGFRDRTRPERTWPGRAERIPSEQEEGFAARARLVSRMAFGRLRDRSSGGRHDGSHAASECRQRVDGEYRGRLGGLRRLPQQ